MKAARSIILSMTLIIGSMNVAAAQDYEKGLKAAQSGDFKTALQEWRPLAEQGDANAQKDLGVMYYTGQGVTQDYDEAVKWYRLAAEQGNVAAQSNLAEMYYLGEDVTQDYTEAVKWLRLAAESGDPDVQFNLGMMYAYGSGVVQSDVMALMWFNIASANGSSTAGEWGEEPGGLMSNADISKAQEMAGECMSSNYQNCGE